MYFDLLWGYFKTHKLQLSALVTTRLCLYFLEIIVMSYLASNLVFNVKEGNDVHIQNGIRLFVLTFCVVGLLWFCIETLNSYIIPSIQDYVRKQILSSVFDEKGTHDTIPIGSTISNLSRIPQLVYVEMISVSYYILPFFFTFLFLFLFFFYRYGRQIGCTFLIIMVLLFTLFAYWFKKIIQISIARYNSELLLSEKFDDALLNSEQIINENLTKTTLEDLDQQEQVYSQLLHQELQCMNAWKQSLDVCTILVMGILMMMGFRQYQSGKMDFAVFTSLIAVVLFIINRIISLINRIGDIPAIMGGVNVSEDMIVQNKQKIRSSGRRRDFIQGKNVSIQDLHFSYPHGGEVLRDIHMDIPFRSSHVIRGESGSGKTTLCRCIMGYFPLQPGQIVIDGVSMEEIDPIYLRQNISIMTQNGFLFDTTALKNISRDENVHERLRSMPIYSKIEPLLHRQVGKLGSKLSGGERQIILLLRAYFRPSFLLILDEPTSNMDSYSKMIITEIIQEIMAEKSVICVTHDDEIVPLFDNLYTISKDGGLTLLTKR